MKKIFFFIFIMLYHFSFSQNIKCETSDYSKKIDDKEYSTFHYINSSYSYSRPIIILITNKQVFMDVHTKIPKNFNIKQEYTDVFLLGIKDLDFNNIDDTSNKIINIYLDGIEKYRKENNLVPIERINIPSHIYYLTKAEDLCKYLVCRK